MLENAGLIKAMNDALVKASPEINLVKQFAFDASDAFASYGQTVKVPVVKHGTLSAFGNDNDYENADGSMTFESVTLSTQYKSTFNVTGIDMIATPNAPYWNRLAQSASDGLKSMISQKFGGLFLSADCTGGDVTLGNTITKATVAKLRKECKARVGDTILGLASDQYAEVASLFDYAAMGNAKAITDQHFTAFGFKNIVEIKDLPEGVKGVLIPDNSIVIASRAVPVADQQCYTEYGTVTDDETGITLTVMRHGTPRTGAAYLNVTSLWGMKIVQGDMIKRLV